MQHRAIKRHMVVIMKRHYELVLDCWEMLECERR